MWSTPHPAFEDGTDRGFRNVGKPQSDAEEIPKRTYTTWCKLFGGSSPLRQWNVLHTIPCWGFRWNTDKVS